MEAIKTNEKTVNELKSELNEIKDKSSNDKEVLKKLGESKIPLLEKEFNGLVAIKEANLQGEGNDYAQLLYTERFGNPDSGYLGNYNTFMNGVEFTDEVLCKAIEKKITSLKDNYLPDADKEKSKIDADVSRILAFDMGFEIEDKKARTAAACRNLYCLNKQVQRNQFHQEEKQRSDGQSGIKQIRTRNGKIFERLYYITQLFQ